MLICGTAYADERVGPPVTAEDKPADYVSNIDRGTIGFNPGWRNYSMHNVVIPDGTVIDGNVMGACNFVQIEPGTDAIIRDVGFGHDLTFIDCNLSNLKTYDDWRIISCNTTQADMFGKQELDGDFNVVYHTVVASKSEDVADDRVKPADKVIDGKTVERIEK